MNRSPSKNLKVSRTGIKKEDGTTDHERLREFFQTKKKAATEPEKQTEPDTSGPKKTTEKKKADK